jgi:hypothetical protein
MWDTAPLDAGSNVATFLQRITGDFACRWAVSLVIDAPTGKNRRASLNAGALWHIHAPTQSSLATRCNESGEVT